MLTAVAELGVPYVAMHWRGYGDRMHENAVYADVVAEVRDELSDRVADAVAAGVDPSAVVIDPGLGFAKDAGHNWALLRDLDRAPRARAPRARRRLAQAVPRRAARRPTASRGRCRSATAPPTR